MNEDLEALEFVLNDDTRPLSQDDALRFRAVLRELKEVRLVLSSIPVEVIRQALSERIRERALEWYVGHHYESYRRRPESTQDYRLWLAVDLLKKFGGR